MTFLLRFLRSEEGPTSVEYAVMLGMIIAVCVGAVTLLGIMVGNMYDDASQRLDQAFQ